MPLHSKRCHICHLHFQGRADARYCSPACRQRAYRERRERGSIEATKETRREIRKTREQARRIREQSKTVIGRSELLREQCEQTVQRAGRVEQRTTAIRVESLRIIQRARDIRGGATRRT